MNCWADIGVPSGCQNVVAIMCWIVRALPSASLTLIFCGRSPPPRPRPPTGLGGALSSCSSGPSGSPLEMVKSLMQKASTRTGLRVFVDILDRFYETGLKLPNVIRDTLRIRFDRLLPLWNYVVLPTPDAEYWEVIFNPRC
jgi:hypothetical protein